MYEGDAPVAERRAQALAVDRALLGELVGESDLRSLLDPEVMQAVEAERQGLADHRRARDADELEDLLRRLGPLTEAEIRARAEEDPAPWMDQLCREARAEQIEIDGSRHLAATGDGQTLAAARGGDIAAAEELLARRARARSPVPEVELAARLDLPADAATRALERLVARGVLVRGAFRPSGTSGELVHSDVLRELKRRTLDRLRRDVAPVDGDALGRFLPAWHGIAGTGGPGVSPSDSEAGLALGMRRGGRGLDGLRTAVRRLSGTPLSLSDLETRILPARVSDYHPSMLDQLGATGELVWIGAGATGRRDGRVILLDRERALLAEPAGDRAIEAPGSGPRAVLDVLAARGASFQLELAEASRLSSDDLAAALWDLVWAGLITNDTFAPLRSWLRSGSASASQSASAPARRPRRRAGAPRPSHFAGGGRWSLVADRVRRGDPTERALARALALLDRYGVVSREAAAADEVSGGFSALGPVLRVLEETGRARRGYFIAALDGRQFALPAAIERLRAELPATATVLAAADPANPYGTLLPWPDAPEGAPRPSRRGGALVLLWHGRPAAYWEAGGRSLITFDLAPGDLASALGAALPTALRLARRRFVRLETVNGQPARTSALAPLLLASGFRPELRALAFELSRAEARQS
jgi:ATP-dependent Lhr-like helicase